MLFSKVRRECGVILPPTLALSAGRFQKTRGVIHALLSELQYD
jgi:hypothetical protein